jgi:tetratricopeptide (TPR) repeat protein
MEMYRALRAAKIGINAAIDMAKREPGSMRILEVTSVGCLLLTEKDSSLCRFLEPDREVVTFGSHGELLDKIEYYLDNEGERQAIAERGRLRILREHSMSVKAGMFASLVKQSLNRLVNPTTQVAHAPRDVRQDQDQTIERIHELLQRAINICEGTPAEALQCLIIASSFNVKVPGLEHLRGLCYLQMGELSSARDALEQELRSFPTNQSARNLLNHLIFKSLNG